MRRAACSCKGRWRLERRAEIVQLENGPVVYNCKDALEENSQVFGDWLIPGQTARFDDGIWLIEDAAGSGRTTK